MVVVSIVGYLISN